MVMIVQQGVDNIFETLENAIEEAMEEVFLRENDPFTVNDDLVKAVDSVRFERFDKVLNDICEGAKHTRDFGEGKTAIKEYILHELGGWYMHNHGAEMASLVTDQRTVLMGYFGVCVKSYG